MKAIDWDKQDLGSKMTQSEKYNAAKNTLARSATNFV